MKLINHSTGNITIAAKDVVAISATVPNYNQIDFECLAYDAGADALVLVEKNHLEESADVFVLDINGKEEEIGRGEVLEARTVGET